MNITVHVVLFSKIVQSNVVCPALKPLAQEGHGPLGAGPEKEPEDD